MLKEVSSLIGLKVIGPDGEIGIIKDLYFDIKHWVVRYALINTRGWLLNQESLISVTDLIKSEVDDFSTKLSKEKIENSPDINSNKPVSLEMENSISDYYGWLKYWLINKTMNSGAENITLKDIPRLRTVACSDDEKSLDSNLRSMKEMSGYSITATDWNAGSIWSFIVNEETWAIEYTIVDTLPWLPSRQVLIHPDAINLVSWCEKKIMIGLDKKTISESPKYDPFGEIDSGKLNKAFHYYDYE